MNKLLIIIGSLALMCGCCSPYIIDRLRPGMPGYLSATDINKALKKDSEPNSKELRLELISISKEEEALALESIPSQAYRDQLKYQPVRKYKLENTLPGERFTVYSKLINDQVDLCHYKIDEEQLTRTYLHLDTFMFGEPIVYAVTSLERNAVATFEFVPYPIEATQAERKITVQMANAARTVFLVIISGFKPYEKVIYTSTSMGEVLNLPMVADPNGNIAVISMPAVVGYTGGKCALSVKSAEMEKPLDVDFSWGTFGRVSARLEIAKMEAEKERQKRAQ